MINNTREATDVKYFLLGSGRNRALAEWAWQNIHAFFIAADQPGPWPMDGPLDFNQSHVVEAVRKVFRPNAEVLFVRGDNLASVVGIVTMPICMAMTDHHLAMKAGFGPGITYDRLTIMVHRYLAEPLIAREADAALRSPEMAANLEWTLVFALGYALLGDREKSEAWFGLAHLWWKVRPLGFAANGAFIVQTR